MFNIMPTRAELGENSSRIRNRGQTPEPMNIESARKAFKSFENEVFNG